MTMTTVEKPISAASRFFTPSIIGRDCEIYFPSYDAQITERPRLQAENFCIVVTPVQTGVHPYPLNAGYRFPTV